MSTTSKWILVEWPLLLTFHSKYETGNPQLLFIFIVVITTYSSCSTFCQLTTDKVTDEYMDTRKNVNECDRQAKNKKPQNNLMQLMKRKKTADVLFCPYLLNYKLQGSTICCWVSCCRASQLCHWFFFLICQACSWMQ